MAALDYKCPGCSGPLSFDPRIAKLKCVYCLSEYDPAQLAGPTPIGSRAEGPVGAANAAGVAVPGAATGTATPSTIPPGGFPQTGGTLGQVSDVPGTPMMEQTTVMPGQPEMSAPQVGPSSTGPTPLPTAVESDFSWDTPDFDYMEAQDIEGLAQSVCNSCGVTLVGPPDVISMVCPYCNNNYISVEALTNMVAPEFIIPLTISKEQALEIYKESSKGKPYLPSEFKVNAIIDKIQPMYVPYWLYSCTVDATVSATISRSSGGTSDYIEKSFYLIERMGQVDVNNMPIAGTTSIERKYLEAIEPFTYSDMTEFYASYLAGIRTMTSTVDIATATPHANNRIRQSIAQAFIQGIRYDTYEGETVGVQMQSSRISYALLPIWMLNVDYEGQRYTFAINGQTGKIVGSYPISEKKKLITKLLWGIPAAAAGFFAAWVVMS